MEQKYSPLLVRNARDINATVRQGRTQGDFTLAVCLSVLITFVCAFCLGAFTRPYIGRIWRQICRKKNVASENVFSNHGFSPETLAFENTTDTQTSLHQKLSFCSGNSSRNAGSFIVKVSSSHKVAIHNGVFAVNVEEANKDQSSNNIEIETEKVSQNNQTPNSADEAAIDNETFSVMSDQQCNNRGFQRELSNNDILSHESKYLFNEDSEKSRLPPVACGFNMDSYSCHTDSDSPVSRETNFSEAQIQAKARGSEYNINNRSNLFQSEIAESLQKRHITSHTQSLTSQQFKLKQHNSNKEFEVNDNINILNNRDNSILPRSYDRDINIDHSNTYQTLEMSPASIQEHDFTEENIRNTDNSVEVWSDSSSIDEGSAFTLSNSSSLTESDLGQSNACDDHLTNLPVTEQVITFNSSTGKSTTLLQSPTITSGFQDNIETTENKNKTYSETATISGSGTGTLETYSSVLHTDSPLTNISDTTHIDKFDDHITLSNSNTNNPSCCEAPDMFEYVIGPNSPAQNMSTPVCKQNVNLNYINLPLNYSPKSTPDTDNIISKNINLHLCEFPTLTQDLDRSTSTDQKENVTEINTEENHSSQSSSLRNYMEDGNKLNIANINTTHVNNNFIFTSIDFGSNCVANKASLLHSNTDTDEPFLPLHSEHTDEKSVADITERQDYSVQQQQHTDMSDIYAQKMQRDFNERECDKHTEQEVLSGIDRDNSSLCTAELQFPNIMTNSSSSETMQEKYLQLDHLRGKNECFSVNPQSFLNENVQHSSHKVSQNAEENTTGNRTNSSKAENETSLAELENNFKAIAVLQTSSEKPEKKNEATRGQLLEEGSFFVKKKKAFDGFASVLQSRRPMDSTK